MLYLYELIILLQLRATVNAVYKIGYMLSLVALTTSLFLFYYLNSLTCTRIQIHKNLFVSLIINGVLWILWYMKVVNDVQVLLENPVWCQVVHVVVHYFMVATYFWMFCEGLYLFTILKVTFLTENRVMTFLFGIGWGLPVVFVALYAILRASASPFETIHCWMEESYFSLALSIPVCLSMILNLIFLVNIVSLLLKKLPTSNAGQSLTPLSSVKERPSFKLKNFRKGTISRSESQEQSISSSRTAKAVRATLILIPLLGLQYILIPFRPEPRTFWEPWYQMISAIVTSGQGLCVSFLFCFFNGEVIGAIKRRHGQSKLMAKRRSWQPCSANTTTVSFSRSSLMQHQHTNQQQIQLNQQYVPQIESEAISPSTTLYHQAENSRNHKSVLL